MNEEDQKGSNFRIIPKVDRVLMSDTLKGHVPSLEEDIDKFEEVQSKHVVVVAEKISGAQRTGLVGILRGVSLGVETEIEFRIDLREALEVIETPGLSFGRFALCHGEDKEIEIPGPFLVKEARIHDISVKDQLCTLGLHLVKPAR